MDEKEKYCITVEKLMNIVHNHTDPIRIQVVMGDSWLSCEEAKNMRDFELVHCFNGNMQEKERLLRYYKNCLVWNLTVWCDGFKNSCNGKQLSFGINAHCYYKDIRDGYLAEKADLKKAKQTEYYKKRKEKIYNEVE